MTTIDSNDKPLTATDVIDMRKAWNEALQREYVESGRKARDEKALYDFMVAVIEGSEK